MSYVLPGRLRHLFNPRPAAGDPPHVVVVDGLTVQLHRHRKAVLTVVHPDGDAVPKLHKAPVTFIVGDAWITLNPGDQKVVRLPTGMELRVATEADVLAYEG